MHLGRLLSNSKHYVVHSSVASFGYAQQNVSHVRRVQVFCQHASIQNFILTKSNSANIR